MSQTKENQVIPVSFGDKIMMRSDNMQIPSSLTCVQIDCHAVFAHLREGDEIKFGDDADVFGEVVSGNENQVEILIKLGGEIRSNSAVKIPGCHYQKLPILRRTDEENILNVALEYAFDYVVVPNVQTGKDISDVREALG